MAEPVRTKRTVVKGVSDLYANYPDPNDLAAYAIPSTPPPAIVPIYDAFNPLQAEMESNPMNRARATLDPERFWIGMTTYRLQGNAYVYGKGDSATGYTNTTLPGQLGELPPWANTFLPAAGLSPSGAGTTPHCLFNPVSESFYHAYLEVYLNKYLHKMFGSRGNLVFSAVASNPVQIAFDFTGLYDPATLASNPSDAGSDPGLPPRLCGIDTLFLSAEFPTALAAFQPNLKSFTLNLGVTTQQRRNANAAGCLQEIGIFSEFNPRLTLAFEVEDFDAQLGTIHGIDVKDFFEAARQGMGFCFELNVGPYTATTGLGERWQFRNYNAGPTTAPNTAGTSAAIEGSTRFPMSMTSSPAYVDVEGIRCYECEFLLGGTDNNWIQICGM